MEGLSDKEAIQRFIRWDKYLRPVFSHNGLDFFDNMVEGVAKVKVNPMSLEKIMEDTK